MTKFILWLILLFISWPLAIVALIFYPIVWFLMLPFRLIGISVDAVFDLPAGRFAGSYSKTPRKNFAGYFTRLMIITRLFSEPIP